MPTSPRGLARGQQFSRAVASKPFGGIRSLHSLSAWGLPTPVVALACTCSVDIQVFFLCKWGNFISYGVCKLVLLGSPLGHPKGVPCAELSPQGTEGLLSTAIKRFHKELRFFFSLLKRKKEAKKEKSSLTLDEKGNASHEWQSHHFSLPSFHLKWHSLYIFTNVR